MSSPTKTNTSSDADVVVIDHDDISNYNPSQILPQTPNTLERIHTWLQPTSYDISGGENKKHLASRAPGTCAWLTSSSAYQQWLSSSEDGLLWISGIPGSGKSVMAASLVDGLKREYPGCPVLFFFFRQIIEANHEPRALLKDWLDQLLEYSPPLQQALAERARGSKVDGLSIEDLWKELKMGLALFPGKVFCVADALDEMDQGHDAFLEALGKLGNWRPEKVKAVITSRPVPTVEVPLRKVTSIRLRLEESQVDGDISTYVHHSLASSRIPKGDWRRIQEAVPGRANGLFLYAKLAMDAFLEPGAEIEDVLRQLPLDLNELYTRLLDEHANRSGVARPIQRLILQSVTHAIRPLRLLELAEMIRVCSPAHGSQELKAAKELVRSACGPLLEVLPDETVSVVHHSFTEYLQGTTRGDDPSGYQVLNKESTHAELALVCLKYLRLGCLEQAEKPRRSRTNPWGHFTRERAEVASEESRLRLQFPFFEYAATNWHRHAVISKTAGGQGPVDAEIRRFLGGELLKKWLAFRWGSGYKGVTRVHVAARLGLVSYVKEAVASMEVDVPDKNGRTPLWWAAYEGQAECLRELISAGANPDRDDSKGFKPLHKAAQRNHHECVKALLEAGVDPLTPRTKNNPAKVFGPPPLGKAHTPLMHACQAGHAEAIDAFLPFLKGQGILHQALAWAADRGQSKVVALILRQGIDPNVKVKGDTPLYRACCSLDAGTIKAILRAGADPNLASVASVSEVDVHKGRRCSGRPEYYPLHRICGLDPHARKQRCEIDNEEELFFALLEAGVDIHRRGKEGLTPLHNAVTWSPILTRLLLDAGADINATDSKGRTPLHMKLTVDTMELLFQLGNPDANQRDNEGRTPLCTMLNLGGAREDDILKLLEYGADCNGADDRGETPLHVVLRDPSLTAPHVASVLLGSGADPNARNREGLTPLLTMDTDSLVFLNLLDTLLEAGADINAEDRKGATMLFRMMERRWCPFDSEEVDSDMKHLMDRGARPLGDRDGRTLLHRAVQTCECGGYRTNDKRLQFVLSLGIDPHVVDRNGNGLLHEVALRSENHHQQYAGGITGLWETLLGMGLDLHLRNRDGRTPLHVLCAGYTADSFWTDQVPPGETSPLDFVIARTEDFEAMDNDGYTPLHLAVSTSQLYAKKLLDAGADPAAETFEGVTPLHMATRDGRSNIVGLLLDALRKRQPAESGGPVPGVNVSSLSTPRLTPLYLACESGRPESVRLLVDAGASVSENMFVACARFEIKRAQRDSYLKPALIPAETTRIAEILDMLIEHGADASLLEVRGDDSPLGEALKECEPYVAGCFADARKQYLGRNLKGKEGGPLGITFHDHVQPYLTEASERALREFDPAQKEEKSTFDLFRYLMVRRDYHLVEQLAQTGVSFLPFSLNTLIQHGFASLVDKIGTISAAAALEEGIWHAHNDPSHPGLWFAKRDTNNASLNPTPFILSAVTSDLPNMPVLRLLVEKFAVDVSEVHHKLITSQGEQKAVRGDSALHYVARGKTWWHVRQALPYLLANGAELEARGEDGATPLQVALAGGYPFSREAAEALIEAGANVNARAEEGGSCLSCAWHDIPMLELLVNRGAAVTPHALCAAISALNVNALRVLLSAPGADPNARLERWISKSQPQLLRETPLMRASGAPSMSMIKGGDHSAETMRAHMEMIKVLLQHGADPFAKVQKRNKDGFEEAQLAGDAPEYIELTLLHHLFRNQYLVDAFLEAPSLDVNHRNAEGQTLLHVACYGNGGLDYTIGSEMGDGNGVSVYERLRELGADIEARDNARATILHTIADLRTMRYYVENTASLKAILAEAPHLVNQRDHWGQTPLHYAIKTASSTRELQIARVLLSNGADVHAVDDGGNTLLHNLAHNLDCSALRSLFEELVAKGLDPNVRNNKGETPLFSFAFRRPGSRSRGAYHCGLAGRKEKHTEDEAFAMLKRLGVDFSARDGEGRGALHVAAEGDVERFRELVRLGLDGMAEDDGGRTPVDVAAACGNRAVLELFEEGAKR